ncbi:MAG: IPT/TIG domain-containing protein [Flavihumibacter sp.]
MPLVTAISPNPATRGEEITLTGTDLDLTYGLLFKGVPDTIKTFISQSATEIRLLLPESANKGTIGVIAPSLIVNESAEAYEVAGDLPPLEPLGLVIYDDALKNGWQKWGGWGAGSVDLDNNENVRDGDKSIKAVFADDWGAPVQLGGGNSSTSAYQYLSLAVYGEPGTAGKEVLVIVNGGKSFSLPITEGEWVETRIPLSTFDSPANIDQLSFQGKGWAGTLYIDHIGLR